MEDFLTSLIGTQSGVLSYLVVFSVLFVCGLGVPLPEDISLIMGGFLVHQGRAELFTMMLVGYVGIVVGDSLIFNLGRTFGKKMGQTPTGLLGRVVTPKKRAQVEQMFKRHGEKIVMVARFLPGVRAVTYFTAGSVGMKYSHFLFFDSVAALASAPLFVYLGYAFGGRLEELFHQVRQGQLGVVGVLVAIIVIFIVVSRRRAKKEAEAEQVALMRPREVIQPQPDSPPREPALERLVPKEEGPA